VKFRQVMLGVIKVLSNLVHMWIQLRNLASSDSKLRILVYHQVCPVDNLEPVQNPWCVSTKSFSEQMCCCQGKSPKNGKENYPPFFRPKWQMDWFINLLFHSLGLPSFVYSFASCSFLP